MEGTGGDRQTHDTDHRGRKKAEEGEDEDDTED